MTNIPGNQSHDELDDADPLIDALLAEFVPGDPGRRRRPPDLSARIIAQLAAPIPDERSPESADDDPVVDALLCEFLCSDPEARRTPPDLSAKILQRLAESETNKRNEFAEDADPVVDTLFAEFVPSDPARRKIPSDLAAPVLAELASSGSRPRTPGGALPTGPATTDAVPLSRLISFLIAVAACITGMIWLAGGNQQHPSGLADAQSDPPVIAADQTGDDPVLTTGLEHSPLLADSDGVGTDEQPVVVDDRAVRGILMEPDAPVVASNADTDVIDRSHSPVDLPANEPTSTPLTLVAAETAATVRQYWNTLGITPTADAELDDIRGRLRARLGVELSDQALADPQRLRNVLAEATNADEITKRWLAQTAGFSVASIARPENSGLIKELSESVAGKSPLDVTLVSLIDGSNEHSDRWYEAIGRGGTEGIAKRLAAVSINADMRCVRCHDSHIGRLGTQDDYWSFVALVRSVVQRKNDRWVVAEQTNPKATFYELTDGRQRMANPKVSGYLLQSSDPIVDFRGWTETLAGSDALAGSMVDSLWKLVHGRPLKPSPVDAFAPPVDAHLDRLHQQLADDLKSNRFDVARTLALIISSPMSRRSVPDVLRGDAVMTANEQQRAAALDLVHAFAASVQTPQSSMKDRIDVAMRRIGGRFNSDGKVTSLAQPLDNRPRNPSSLAQLDGSRGALSFSQQLSVDFPGDEAAFPVSWLRSIESYELKLQHLVYLSGRSSVTDEFTDAAMRLKEAGSEESALSRVWWILRN